MTDRPTSAERATSCASTPVSAPELEPVAVEDGRREMGDRAGVSGRRRRMATLVVLTLIVALGGCRSGGKREGAREPGTTVNPSGGEAAPGGDGAAPADGATGADGQPGTVGAPGRTDGEGSAPAGGAGGTGGTGGRSIGAPAPIVGTPTDPGAGPPRPKGW